MKIDEQPSNELHERIEPYLFEAGLDIVRTILAKNLGDVLSRGLSYQSFKAFEARPQSAFRPGLKGLEGLLNGLVPEFLHVLFN